MGRRKSKASRKKQGRRDGQRAAAKGKKEAGAAACERAEVHGASPVASASDLGPTEGLSARLLAQRAKLLAHPPPSPTLKGLEGRSSKIGRVDGDLVVSDSSSLRRSGLVRGLLCLIAATAGWAVGFYVVLGATQLAALPADGLAGMSAFVGVPLACTFVYLSASSFVRREQARRRTGRTTGLLVKVWLHTQRTSNTTVGAVVGTLRYELGRSPHDLDHYPLGSVYSNSWDKIEAKAATLRVGSTRLLHVDPDNPLNVGLKSAAREERLYLVWLCLVAVPAAAALGFFVSVLLT